MKHRLAFRTNVRWIGALLVALAVTVAAPAATKVLERATAAPVGNCTPEANWGTNRPDLAARVVELVNQHRASLGLQPLNVSPTLTNSAVWKSLHMAYYNYLQHDDPPPPFARTVGERLEACGYPASLAGWGENAAYGYPTPEAVMQGWLGSPSHRSNIENPYWRVIGVGAAQAAGGALFWTQDFGTFDDSGAPPPTSTPTPTPTPPPPTPTPTPPEPTATPTPPPPEPTATPPPEPEPTPTQFPTLYFAHPSSVVIQRGALESGSATSVWVNDGDYLQVGAYAGATAWYGRFWPVPNSLQSLTVIYSGLNSLSCQQTLSIWSWSLDAWVVLDSRPVDTSEVGITATPPGPLASYVSGTSDEGTVAVRVRCARGDYLPFSSMGDLMEIRYED
jgi:uncharacterized protein YkwD